MSESGIEQGKEKISRAITENTQAAHVGALGLASLRGLHESYVRGHDHLQKIIQQFGYEMAWVRADYGHDVQQPADYFSDAEDHTINALKLFDSALGEEGKDTAIFEGLVAARLSYINLHVLCGQLGSLQDECTTVLGAMEKLPEMIGLSGEMLEEGGALEGIHSTVNSLAFEYVLYL